MAGHGEQGGVVVDGYGDGDGLFWAVVFLGDLICGRYGDFLEGRCDMER